MEEFQTDEIQPRLAGDDTRFVLRGAIGVKDRQVDPGETRIEAGAPDHVRDVKYAAVFEHWPPILDAGDARHARDPGRNKVLGFRADERFAVVQHLCAHLPAYRSLHSQNSVEHHSQYKSD